MFSADDLQALAITLQLALLSTLILLFIGTPLAWWLARSRWRWRFLCEALVALPLVLPPTVPSGEGVPSGFPSLDDASAIGGTISPLPVR